MKDDHTPGGPDARRRLILDTARTRFLEDGYVAAAMERVARECGMSTATLYAAFPGKTELFEAVVLDASLEFVARMRSIDLTTGSAETRIRAFARGYAAFLSDPFVRGILRLVGSERRRMPVSADEVFDYGKLAVGGPLIEALEALAAAGEVKVDNPSWAAGQLMGLIEHPLLTNAMLLGDDFLVGRAPDDVADDAVLTFMARYGA